VSFKVQPSKFPQKQKKKEVEARLFSVGSILHVIAQNIAAVSCVVVGRVLRHAPDRINNPTHQIEKETGTHFSLHDFDDPKLETTLPPLEIVT
jgi:hypothetical protein